MKFEQLLKSYCIALTGGIATGKSFVSNILKDLGFFVCDADLLAKKILKEDAQVIAQIESIFGKEILNLDGSINRKKLRNAMVEDNKKRFLLESCVHPAIEKQLEIELQHLNLFKKPKVWFYEAALIYEKKKTHKFKNIWVTHCNRNLQLNRIIERDKVSIEDAEAIIQTQISNLIKVQMADFVIDTSQSKDEIISYINSKLRSF